MDCKKGFFFDLDGTLIDNINVMIEAYFSFMNSYNQKGSEEEFDRYNGIPINIFLRDFINKNSLSVSVSTLWAKYEEHLLKKYKTIKPRDGVIEVFKLLEKKEIPFAIVTSATKNIAFCWAKYQLRGLPVPLIITCDDVNKTKPDSEPYVKAMKLLNCETGFAVEDSVNGLKSALGAGLTPFLFHTEGQHLLSDKTFKTINHFNQLELFIESL